MFQERESKGFQAYDGPIGDFNFESLPVEYATRAIQKFKVLASWRLTFNELEGIAAAFVTGVADEQVGFVILGSDGIFKCHSHRLCGLSSPSD
jgi:hypothetical protein